MKKSCAKNLSHPKQQAHILAPARLKERIVNAKSLLLFLMALCVHQLLFATNGFKQNQQEINEVAIISADVTDAELLAQNLGKNIDVHILNRSASEIDQVTAILSKYHDLHAVHLMTHGSAGSIRFAEESITTRNLSRYTIQLKEWQKHLKAGGDLLLYGCEIAKGRTGTDFLNELNKVVGLDLAASYDKTTSSDKGNWGLEKHIGAIETKGLFYTNYKGTLQTPPDGLYTFAGAIDNGNNTFKTADDFFLISGNNGSSDVTKPDKVSADEFGAFIDDSDNGTSGTSYLEVKVKNGGSFKVSTAVVGEWSGSPTPTTNNFFDVYAVGFINGVEVARTPSHNSIGVYQSDYNLNFSNFLGKAIDAFRVYYSWNSGTTQVNFNFQDMTIYGASTNSLPILSTSTASDIGSTSATLGGNITASGGAAVTERGIVWATTNNPTTANNKVQIGTGSGSFSQSITGLPSNTTLYARAYAINSVGIAYGSQVSFATNSLLPVSLLQLSAHQKPEGVHLQWSTVSEEAAKDFEIQYSTDGRQWSYIGTVAATGNTTSIRHYQFTHRHATNGTNYYRLLQRDLDGKSTFSKVVQVTISTGSVFAIHNNPVSDRIIKISMQVSETVQLYNGAGALVLHQKLQPGIHTINVQRLPGGMYQIKAGRETRTLILK